ncbi:60Kd inner membrane protein-domain-containing protein [Xylariales sp. AK1849]|nr:60Kd inner membrane protein-domain-containing protein [Xylariales sp. AK1849]
MSVEEPSSHLAESGVTMHSDSEQYSAGEEASTSPESSSSSPPLILYQPPTIWGLVRGAAINLLLPFVNGMMLGFGELFAHEAAFRLGWSGTKPTAAWRILSRQFSQVQRLGQSPPQWNSCSAALRGHSTTSLRLASAIRNPLRIGIASGASRSLSLWPFGSNQPASEPRVTEATPSMTNPTGSPASAYPSSSDAAWPSPTSAPSPHSQSAEVATIQTPAAADLSKHPEVASTPLTDPISSSFSPESFGDLDTASILDIPEQIGYLKHLGLDFGWGPTAMCEYLLEHVYIYTGLPWWATIATVAFGIRLVIFWPTVVGSKHAARMAVLQKDPEFVKASQEMKEVMWNPDAETVEKMKLRAKVTRLTKAANVSMWKTIAGPLAMVPLSYGMFRLLRAMSALPVPSLETGGFAWISDLSVYDPTYILPLATATLSFLSMKQHQASNMNPTPQSETINKFMAFGLTPFMFFVTMWFPAAVQWFFFVFTLSTTAQSKALLNPTMRRMADLPPLSQRPLLPTTSKVEPLAGAQYQAPSRGVRGLLDGVSKNAESLTKGIEDYTGGEARQSKKKALEYEKRRSQEEKEKVLNRMIERSRKKLHNQN